MEFPIFFSYVTDSIKRSKPKKSMKSIPSPIYEEDSSILPTVPMPSGRPMNNNSDDGTQSFNSHLSEENTIRSRSASFAPNASFAPSATPNTGSFQHPTSSQASYHIISNRTSSFGQPNNNERASNFLQTYVRPIIRPIVKLIKVTWKNCAVSNFS